MNIVNTRRRNARWALPVSAAVAMCGCGTTTDLTSIVSISQDNYATVSAKVVNTMQSVIAVGAQGGTTTNSAAGVTTTSGSGALHLMDFSWDALQKVITARSQGAEPSVTGTSVATTVPCDSGNISVASSLDGSGTTYALTFNNCEEQSLTYTFNGAMTLSNVQTTGDLSAPATPGTLSAEFDLNAVQATKSRRSNTTIQGAFNYNMTSSDGVTFDQSIRGTKLTTTQPGDLTILSTFDFAITQDSNTSKFSYTASGNIYSTALGGSITFANQSPFTGVNLIADSPDHGVMLITGRSNSNVVMTALFAGFVNLDVDTDGNGTVDTTRRAQWSAIR